MGGPDVHRKEEFLGLDKSYTLEVLWGVETDSYDLLGKPLARATRPSPGRRELEAELERWTDTFTQPYPPFSSKPVAGKPLWQWAREGRLDEIRVPDREVSIYSISRLSDREITAGELLAAVRDRLRLITGDFRQAEIAKRWTELTLSGRRPSTFRLSKLAVNCSSGTYMRSLAYELGRSLDFGGCAFSITRWRIGLFQGDHNYDIS